MMLEKLQDRLNEIDEVIRVTTMNLYTYQGHRGEVVFQMSELSKPNEDDSDAMPIESTEQPAVQ